MRRYNLCGANADSVLVPTDSRHSFKCYPDLVNTEPKLTPTKLGELIVADITYVACNCDKGSAFLSLVTDVASRCL